MAGSTSPGGGAGLGGCTGLGAGTGIGAGCTGAAGALTTTSTCASCPVDDSVKVKSYFPTGKFGMVIAAPDTCKGTLVVAPEFT